MHMGVLFILNLCSFVGPLGSGKSQVRPFRSSPSYQVVTPPIQDYRYSYKPELEASWGSTRTRHEKS